MKKTLIITRLILFFVIFSVVLIGCMKSEQKTPEEQQKKESTPAAAIRTAPAPKAETTVPASIIEPPADRKKESQTKSPNKSASAKKPVLEYPTDKITPKSSRERKPTKYAKAGETSRDAHFISYDNGTVLDTSTKLMWAAKDNGKDINWKDAKSYCENYRGGGFTDWRLPKQDELADLYNADKAYKSDCGWYVHLTKLIRLTCYWVWASETSGSDSTSFDFYGGFRYSYPQSYGNMTRAIPVRSGK